MVQDINLGPFDCIIFYRWFSPDGKQERGRIMARLVAEILRAMNVRVWLDQHHMSRDSAPEQVVAGIYQVFQRVRYVIILAGPGDWQRFSNQDDIHRWEWEISLKSGKPIWVLQYETDPNAHYDSSDLALRLGAFYQPFTLLVAQNRPQVRNISTENLDSVLNEIAKNNKVRSAPCSMIRRTRSYSTELGKGSKNA